MYFICRFGKTERFVSEMNESRQKSRFRREARNPIASCTTPTSPEGSVVYQMDPGRARFPCIQLDFYLLQERLSAVNIARWPSCVNGNMGNLEKMRGFIGRGYLAGLDSKRMALKAAKQDAVPSAEILASGLCRGGRWVCLG